jgi:hypothetical protein
MLKRNVEIDLVLAKKDSIYPYYIEKHFSSELKTS